MGTSCLAAALIVLLNSKVIEKSCNGQTILLCDGTDKAVCIASNFEKNGPSVFLV